MNTIIALGNNWRPHLPNKAVCTERPDRCLSIESRLTAMQAWVQYTTAKKIDTQSMLLFTGGKTNANVPHSEAAAMVKYLQRKGCDVDEEHILREEESLSTIENAENTKLLLHEINRDIDEKITLVTSPYHLHRATCVFRRQFADSIICGVESTRPMNDEKMTKRNVFSQKKERSWDWHMKHSIDQCLRLITLIDPKGYILNTLTNHRGK